MPALKRDASAELARFLTVKPKALSEALERAGFDISYQKITALRKKAERGTLSPEEARLLSGELPKLKTQVIEGVTVYSDRALLPEKSTARGIRKKFGSAEEAADWVDTIGAGNAVAILDVGDNEYVLVDTGEPS